MRQLISFFFFLLTAHTAIAQDKLCIYSGRQAGTLAFNAVQVNNLMHLDAYKGIFFGEQHNNTFDPLIKYCFIATMSQSLGLRHVFIETGAAAAWRFNQYLQTGDTSWLYSVSLPFTVGGYRRFWQQLYDYNKILPANKKLVMHGIDFERTEVFTTLLQLMPEGQAVPASLQALADTLTAHRADKPLAMYSMEDGKMTGINDNSVFIHTLEYIQDELRAHQADAKTLYGANYPVVEAIITNPNKVTVKPVQRNKSMYKVMEKIIAAEHIDKFIGFFGNMHTSYKVGSSLANAAADLPGMKPADILNVSVYVNDMYDPVEMRNRIKDLDMLLRMNRNCRASIIPVALVPSYRKEADFIIVADNDQ